MKILLSATSSMYDEDNKQQIIEVNSLDEAISILLINKELVKALINEENSCIKDYTPREFVVTVNSETAKYAAEVEIYDDYRE